MPRDHLLIALGDGSPQREHQEHTDRGADRVGDDVGDGRVTLGEQAGLGEFDDRRQHGPGGEREHPPSDRHGQAEEDPHREEQQYVGGEFDEGVVDELRNAALVEFRDDSLEHRRDRTVDRARPEHDEREHDPVADPERCRDGMASTAGARQRIARHRSDDTHAAHRGTGARDTTPDGRSTPHDGPRGPYR